MILVQASPSALLHKRWTGVRDDTIPDAPKELTPPNFLSADNSSRYTLEASWNPSEPLRGQTDKQIGVGVANRTTGDGKPLFSALNIENHPLISVRSLGEMYREGHWQDYAVPGSWQLGRFSQNEHHSSVSQFRHLSERFWHRASSAAHSSCQYYPYLDASFGVKPCA